MWQTEQTTGTPFKMLINQGHPLKNGGELEKETHITDSESQEEDVVHAIMAPVEVPPEEPQINEEAMEEAATKGEIQEHGGGKARERGT
jgi:hypothetical protein